MLQKYVSEGTSQLIVYMSKTVLFVCIHADIIKRLLRRLVSLVGTTLQLPQGSWQLPCGSCRAVSTSETSLVVTSV